MTKNMKLVLARMLLPVVTVFMVMAPVRAYSALLDVGARVALAYMTSPQTRFVVNNTIGMVLGATVLYFGVHRADNSGHTRDDQFFTTNNPRDPTAAEDAAGFQKAQPGHGSSPVPPPWVPPKLVWGVAGGMTPLGNTAAEACSKFFASPDSGVLNGVWCTGYNQYGNPLGNTVELYSWSACPVGYQPDGTGSGCSVADPAAIAKPIDAVCPIVRVGNTYTADGTDPDCNNGQMPGMTSPGSGVSVWTWTPSADGRHASLRQNADGSITFIEAEPNADGATTQTTTINTNAPADDLTPPVVVGSTSANTQGQGIDAGSAVVQSVTLAGSPAPTDYAKSGDALAAAAAIIAADQAYRDGEAARTEQARGIPPSAESIPSRTVPVSFVSTIFASNATCPSPIGFDMFGRAYSISYDPACNLMAYLRPLFLALGAFSAAYVFMSGLKA